MRYSNALAFALWLLSAQIVHGFEQHGFRSGMTLAEVTSATNEPIIDMGKDGNYQVGKFPPVAIIAFCKGKLFAVNENISGGVDSFAARTKAILAQLGSPKIVAGSDYTNEGLLSFVRLKWITESNEEISVSISNFKSNVFTSVGTSAFKSICN